MVTNFDFVYFRFYELKSNFSSVSLKPRSHCIFKIFIIFVIFEKDLVVKIKWTGPLSNIEKIQKKEYAPLL